MKIKINGICAVSWGTSYFEVKVGFNEYFEFVNIPLSFLKHEGITKTLKGFKKLRNWLESKEGQKYLLEQPNVIRLMDRIGVANV